MDRIFSDLRQAKRTMTDEAVPGLLDRGRKLDLMAESVEDLLVESDRFNVNAGRVEERRDRLKIKLGLCCLCLCCLTIVWYTFGFARMSLVREYYTKTIVNPGSTIAK